MTKDEKPPPLGTNQVRAYNALIERAGKTAIFGKMARPYTLPDMARAFLPRTTEWNHGIRFVEKDAPVIRFPGTGMVWIGPFEALEDRYRGRMVEGDHYADLWLPLTSVTTISESEFYKLFMRPWTWWRLKRWQWFREWT